MKNFSGMSASGLIGFLSNFITVAGTAGNEELLGYTAADITALNSEKTGLQNALNDQKAKQEAAKAATNTLNTALKAARADMSTRNRNIQGNARVTNALKTALGLNVRATKPVQHDPVPPEKLTVTGLASGVNVLQWNAGGNVTGVQYVIEVMYKNTSWTRIDGVTARRYEHAGQTPGVPAFYRVSARRRNVLSLPSNEASVYAEGTNAPTLTLLKAA